MQDIGTKGKAGMEVIKVQGENKGKIKQEGGRNQMGTLLQNGHHSHP